MIINSFSYSPDKKTADNFTSTLDVCLNPALSCKVEENVPKTFLAFPK